LGSPSEESELEGIKAFTDGFWTHLDGMGGSGGRGEVWVTACLNHVGQTMDKHWGAELESDKNKMVVKNGSVLQNGGGGVHFAKMHHFRLHLPGHF
jgi:hypothetical protein